MLNNLKNTIDTALKAYIKELCSETGLNASSRLLNKCIKDFVERDGKRIRPLLFLTSYMGYTKKRNVSEKDLLRTSLAFELLHDFLLIHDDVIDNSDLRRGKPSMHRLLGEAFGLKKSDKTGSDLSIVAGDIIFAYAVSAFLSIKEDPARKEEALKLFLRNTVFTGIGEYIDVVNNFKKIDRVSSRDILLTYTLKTSKYTFEAPLLCGAILAGAKKKDMDKLSRLGIILGQAFQINDDLLDVFSSSKKTGKPALSDLSESKKTMLMRKTFDSLNKKDRSALKKLLETDKKTSKDLNAVKDLIKKTSSGEYCRKKTLKLLKESEEICAGLKIKTKYRVAIDQLIDRLSAKTKELKI